MQKLAALTAVALFSLGALATAPAFAAPQPVIDIAEAPVVSTEGTDLAVYCEYVIVWDAWGNAYYEYYCY